MKKPFTSLMALALGAGLTVSSLAPVYADSSASLIDLSERPASFADLAEAVSPAVVNITTTTLVEGATGPQGMFPEGSPFEDFFKDFDNDGEGEPSERSALGSGFVISADGYIVTNNHVIEEADEIEIEFFPEEGQRSRRLPAKLIGTDPVTDIALLKVESDTPLAYVEFGDSDGEDAEVGDWVLAMGNPLGQGFSISAGIISARQRSLQKTYDDYIQTDAAINRGNSGGPLFDMAGDVIGVNTAILSPNGGSIGIGFAQASSVVEKVVDQLKEFGETRRGWLGVRIQDISDDMVDAIDGLEEPYGAMVTEALEGPAREAGIEDGDIIINFNGNDIEDTRELVRVVGDAPVGDEVDVTVLRDGETVSLQVVLGRRETATAAQDGPEKPMEPEMTEMMGLSLQEITPELAEEFGLDDAKGLIVTGVDGSSEAANKGLQPGDVITEAGQAPLAAISDFEAAVEASREAGRKSILLLVRRDGSPRFVALPLGDE